MFVEFDVIFTSYCFLTVSCDEDKFISEIFLLGRGVNNVLSEDDGTFVFKNCKSDTVIALVGREPSLTPITDATPFTVTIVKSPLVSMSVISANDLLLIPVNGVTNADVE